MAHFYIVTTIEDIFTYLWSYLISFYMRCHRYFALIYHLKLVYLHKPKFLSCYTLRYHRCYAPRYRVYKANLHNFRLTQLLYGSVTLARCAVLPCRFSLPPTTSRGFLSHSPMATYNTLWQCTDLTIGLRRTWCNGRMRRCAPLRPITLGFPRRRIDYYP